MTCNFRAAGRRQAWAAWSAMARAHPILQRSGFAVVISCLITTTAWGQVVGPAGNIPLPSEELAQRLSHGGFDIVSVKGAGGGIMGAKKLRLRFDDGVEIDVKWKRAPAGAEGWNNSPRREIAAYEVQKLFLEPEEYVVPVSVPRCIPLDTYAAVERHTQGNVLGADCVLGLLSVWLQNVMQPEKLFDPGRFQRDASYARSLGHLNILTYLINHQDGRANNFLISTVEQKPRLFSIDNGLAFSTVFHNYFIPNWNRIRVPSLPGKGVERLRAVQREDLDRLAVLAEMKGDEHDVLQNVKASENWNRLTGARFARGRVQFGLTVSEIDAIEERLAKLLRDVDEGKVAVVRR
jgi:hypothetical protein